MTTRDIRHERAAALLVKLKGQHPVFKQHRPLAIGIDEALIAAYPDEEVWLILQALRLHIHSDAYIQALAHGGQRYDLSNQPLGEVSDDHRQHARTTLKHRHGHRKQVRSDGLATAERQRKKHGKL